MQAQIKHVIFYYHYNVYSEQTICESFIHIYNYVDIYAPTCYEKYFIFKSIKCLILAPMILNCKSYTYIICVLYHKHTHTHCIMICHFRLDQI